LLTNTDIDVLYPKQSPRKQTQGQWQEPVSERDVERDVEPVGHYSEQREMILILDLAIMSAVKRNPNHRENIVMKGGSV